MERINQPLPGPPVLLIIITDKHNSSIHAVQKTWTSYSLSNSLLLILQQQPDYNGVVSARNLW